MGASAVKRKRERLDDEKPAAPPEQYGARASQARVCKTCGHAYINPCINDKMLAKCPNAQWLATKGKKRAKG